MAASRVKPLAETAADQRGDDHVARMRRLAQGPVRLPPLAAATFSVKL